MPSKLYNRARVTITSTGTGTLSLGPAVSGYQTFASAGAQNNDVVSYVVEDGLSWEVGTGTFNSAANTLTRTVTQSYNGSAYGTSPISVTTAAQVFISPLAADLQAGTAAGNLVQLDGSGKLPAVDGSQLTNVQTPPGGTTGQVQYNAGSNTFGGFTVSGDGTLNTSTGALVVTKTNGTSFGPLATASSPLSAANGGTGLTSLGTGIATALGVNVGTAGSVVVNGGALGTPSSGTLTNATGLPIDNGTTGTLTAARGGTGLTSLGTGVATALGNTTNSASGFVVLDASTKLPAVDGSQLTGISTTPANGSVTPAKLSTGGPSWDTSGNVTVSGTLAMGSSFLRNRLINGNFSVAQRGTSFTSTGGANNDDTYNLDRWYILSDGNDVVDITQATDVPANGSKYSIGLDVETVNKKFGIAQIIENINCQGLIGNSVSLSFKARVTSTTKLDNVKAAVVAWSGTADTVTSDIISAWNVEGTNPTLIANATYENTPANLNVTTSWATYKIENIPIDTASTTNVIVFIWSDVTDTTLGDFLYVTDVQLEEGTVATAVERRQYGTELALCQRYYQYYTGVQCSTYWSGTGNSTGSSFVYNVAMRATPSSVLSGQVYSYCTFFSFSPTTNQNATVGTGANTSGAVASCTYNVALTAEL